MTPSPEFPVQPAFVFILEILSSVFVKMACRGAATTFSFFRLRLDGEVASFSSDAVHGIFPEDR